MKPFLAPLALGVVIGMSALQIPALVASEKSAAEALLLEVPSPLGFEETLARLEANAKGEGWKVPGKWKINFQKNLKHVTGIDIGPNQVISMCEPKAAADMLQVDEYKKLAALMPCSIAVYEKSDGKTYVSMMNMDMMAATYGGKVAEWVSALRPQMEAMLKL